ncbi:MAG TPA: GNAT family N-acetyltransferase [Acidimicrobiia bacterium]|nr:GNAT family N-acetyltransferase [Acidimicrobiia bacterium]
MADLRFVEAGRDRADQIRELLEVSHPGNPKAEPGVVEWQYYSNPFGPTHTMIALDGDRIVGHLTSYSLPITMGTESVTAATRVDAATHAAYRRRGIYTALMTALGEACRADGAAFLLTTPNPHSAGPARAIGFTEIAEPRLFVLPVKGDWIRRMTGLPSIVARATTAWMSRSLPTEGARPVAAVPEGIDGLATRLWGDDLVGVRPDHQWWQWRFAEHPGDPYEFYETRKDGALEGALVLRRVIRRDQPALQIVDALALSPEAARSLVGCALADAPESGAVIAVGAGGGPFVRFLSRVGLRRVPRRIRGRRGLLGMVPLAVGAERVAPFTWAVSGGVFDFT